MAAAEWKDISGNVFEMKRKNAEWWHRRKGEPEENWRKGHPPGFIQKAKVPLDQRRDG